MNEILFSPVDSAVTLETKSHSGLKRFEGHHKVKVITIAIAIINMKITITIILKAEVHKEKQSLNPFSDSFDADKLRKLLTNKVGHGNQGFYCIALIFKKHPSLSNMAPLSLRRYRVLP